MSIEPVEFIYYDPDEPPPPLPAVAYARDLVNDVCYVGHLRADGSGYDFDGKETVVLMPNLWEGDNA